MPECENRQCHHFLINSFYVIKKIYESLPEEDNVKFYNRSVDNNASMVVFRLKQLLQSEEKDEEDQEKEFNDGDYNGQPKQRRIVYINNQRVELESEV